MSYRYKKTRSIANLCAACVITGVQLPHIISLTFQEDAAVIGISLKLAKIYTNQREWIICGCAVLIVTTYIFITPTYNLTAK